MHDFAQLENMSPPVEIWEEDGTYTAIDSETGTRRSGETRAIALAALAVELLGGDAAADHLNSKSALRLLSARVQDRFEEEGVTEEDVGDAIAWARSES